MNESNKTLDDLFTAGALDLGSGEQDYDPFAQEDSMEDPSSSITPFPVVEQDSDANEDELEADENQPENKTPVQPEFVQKNVSAPTNVTAPDFNPLTAAVSKADEQNVRTGAAGVFAKPPVFTYGSAKEDITDKGMTFEQLRIAKSEDFPELDDQKKVTWTMEYGTITKQVPKPKEMVIQQLKEEIETSKEFLEMLKKAKSKPETLICKVKPRITAQSKGTLPSYKGVFTSVEEAEQSGKAIQILPASDGKVYEIRLTEAGRFVVPVKNVPELSKVRAGFFPALPRIPFSLICQVIGFFRHFMGEQELEAMVQIYWDKEQHEYRIAVPKQLVSKASVVAQIDAQDALDEDRYVCFADIHSHNSMPAKFSATDDRDERMTRVYIVIGELHRYFPAMSARISCGGRFWPIDPATVIEGIPQDFPVDWSRQVTSRNNKAIFLQGKEAD